MRDKYCFPAIFTIDIDSVGVVFPDIPLATEGDNIEDALYMARDALEGRLYLNERDGDYIPEPSNPLELKAGLAENQIVVPIEANINKVREKVMNKAVNKMVTLPRWLIEEGKEAEINFSHTLQDALMDKLGIKREIRRRKVSS